jgi:hypothetical protein
MASYQIHGSSQWNKPADRCDFFTTGSELSPTCLVGHRLAACTSLFERDISVLYQHLDPLVTMHCLAFCSRNVLPISTYSPPHLASVGIIAVVTNTVEFGPTGLESRFCNDG